MNKIKFHSHQSQMEESKYTDFDDFERTGILSDREILEEIKDGHIIIDPFHPEQLSNCSYDVSSR